MTVSPSLSGIADHATSSILDASNYTIQAISFGKDASAYQYNAHALNSRRNLLYYSTPSAQGDDPNGQIYWNTTYTEVCSAPEILPPTQYENVPSSVAHALSVTDISTSGNGGFAFGFGSPLGAFPSWSTSGGQDNWFCYSVYIKSPVLDEPYHPYPYTSTAPRNRPHIKMQLVGENFDNLGGFAKSRSSTDPYFASPDFTTLSGVGIGFYTDNRGAATGGYSIDYWDEGSGIEEAGNGWYKVWTSVLAPVSGLSGINITISPAGWEASPTGETSGGIYTYGHQLELGRWPTSRQFNNQGYEANNWDLSGSVLNRDHSPGAVTDNGTVRVLNDPIPNPNILSYTVDPWDSPGISPGSYTAGEYWSANSTGYVASFSSILETNPFGGVSSVELSAPVITGGNWPHISLKEASAIAAAGYPVNQSRTFKKGYDNIYSTYIKKPSSNATSAFSLALQDWYNPDPEGNSVVFEFRGGGTVPTFKSTSYGYNSYLIEAVGNDWYRITLIIYGLGSGGANGDTVEGDGIVPFIMMGHHGLVDPTGVSLKRLWFYAPQLEQWPTGTKLSPTKYREVSGGVPTYAEDNLLTSSYVPTNYLSSPPNPESTRVEDGNTALFDTSSPLSGFNMGQNLNVIPYREQGSQLPNFLNLYPNDAAGVYSSFNVKKGQQFLDWRTAVYPPTIYSFSGMGSLGPQAYYLGCYPEGSSTGGSNWALVSSLDNSAAYLHVANGTDPNFISGTYNSIVNEASSMDVSGFVGKVYDAKNKVGVVSNPNHWQYTNNISDDPGITINTDLAGNFYQLATRFGSASSVPETNPFGGASSIQLSATDDLAALDYWPIMSTPKIFSLSSTHNITFSVYVKQPTGEPQGVTRFGINVYNVTKTHSTTAWYDFSGTVHGYPANGTPVFVSIPANTANFVGQKIEDAGNGWWRMVHSVSGIGDVASPNQWEDGDDIRLYLYLSDSDVVYTNVAGSALLISGPQMEQHPISYNLSATPYQPVAGASPTIAEQNGTGGLHVSGGVDATNSGTVEYSMLIGSGDVGYSNLYGGIYNMGLWTIDMDKTLKAGNTPPYSFGPLNNPRKYKLFSTKHLTKNLGFIEDSGTNAGSLNYTDLTIKWRLHFL